MRLTAKRPPVGPPFSFSLIWLIYLIFPLYGILELPPVPMTGSLLLLAVFVGLYLHSFRFKQYRFAFVLGQIAIVGIFCFWHGDGFMYLAFYPSPVIAFLKSRRQTGIAVGFMILLFVAVGWRFELFLHKVELLQFLPALLIMIIMPIALRMGRKSEELKKQLHLANEEIARLSKQEERQRISRDLHDTLGHTLSLITLKSELAEKLIAKSPESAIQEVRDIQNTSRAALNQVRELVTGMNLVTVKEELIQAKQLAAAAGMLLEAHGVDTETNAEEIGSPLADNILGMCLREAVTNAIKYSRASVLRITCEQQADRLLLSVADNGIGFEPKQQGKPGDGNGIRGMKERLRLVEGTLEMDTGAGRGTRLTFTVPRVVKTANGKERYA
ncbi:sensor histidine kinase [Paenibacillus sp. J31TS4]|uniref:sensor histidine kinase n=1 Tax=Paenibacillus sp. J31TS4 TaxID=2807195 RepID=UPI001B0EC5C1|nr:sensor histidine kinase [Paenibacillus sp. J31TS4]GIP37767.1 sensor histidine kinase [Paenibacillus sp. J31TS4]